MTTIAKAAPTAVDPDGDGDVDLPTPKARAMFRRLRAKGMGVQQAIALTQKALGIKDSDEVAKAFNPLEHRDFHGRWTHGVGPEGARARERHATPLTTELADTRDKLGALPVGQRYGLWGPQGQIGHVERTPSGFALRGPSAQHDRNHTSASAAAIHAIRLQRQAAERPGQARAMTSNWQNRQEVAAMNARQATRAAAEVERQRAIRQRSLAKASGHAPYAALHPPIRHHGRQNWVDKVGGLPGPIDAIARVLISKGWDESRAVATAVSTAKRSCATGRAFGGRVPLKPASRAVICKAVAEWEAKKAAA